MNGWHAGGGPPRDAGRVDGSRRIPNKEDLWRFGPFPIFEVFAGLVALVRHARNVVGMLPLAVLRNFGAGVAWRWRCDQAYLLFAHPSGLGLVAACGGRAGPR